MTGRPSPATFAPFVGALLGVLVLWRWGLTSYVLTDYRVEALPAMDRLVAGDLGGYFAALPGYGGALMLESPFAALGGLLGPDPVTGVWRSLAIPGLGLLLVGGVVLGRRVQLAVGGRGGAAWGAVTAASFAGSPIALLALQLGHPEELLTCGLMIGGVALALRGRAVAAGIAVGLAAAGKPWALVAVPVVLLAAEDRRALARTTGAVLVAGIALSLPMLLSQAGAGTTASASSSATGIFKPSNVFWFLGAPNPQWDAVHGATTRALQEADSAREYWAQRLEPAVVGRVSHPLIIFFAAGLAAGFAVVRRGVDARRDDLLLLLAAVCWWRCLLDTWNVHYYALGTVLALVAWQARRGRPPVLAIALTVLLWSTFRVGNLTATNPDLQAGLYLVWAVPVGLTMIWRCLAPRSAARAGALALRPVVATFPTFTGAARAQATRG